MQPVTHYANMKFSTIYFQSLTRLPSNCSPNNKLEFSVYHSRGESRSRNCSAIQSMNTRRRGDKCRACE
jgi:hypothetical protein